MGDCASRPEQNEIQQQENSNIDQNNKYFNEKTDTIETLSQEDLKSKLENAQIQELRQLERQLTQKNLDFVSKKNQAANKVKELQSKLKQETEKALLKIEIRKGRNIPNTNGCNLSQPFVEVEVLNNKSETPKSKA